MAIQRQPPSNILRRLPQSAKIESPSFVAPPSNSMSLSIHGEPQAQPAAINLLCAYNTAAGLNFGHPNSGIMVSGPPSDMAYDLLTSRKRSRQTDVMIATHNVIHPDMHLEKPDNVNSPYAGTISTGLTYDIRLNPSAASGNEGNISKPFSSALAQEVNTHLIQQTEDIDELIKMQGEHMKQALQEKMLRHQKTLLTSVEEGIMKQLRKKEFEVEKIKCNNLKLEEWVKQLSLEIQLWQNLAKNNELAVFSLRASLAQIVAWTREQNGEACGEAGVDDAESCILGETVDAHLIAFKENKELKEQKLCRICGTNNVCILLLPCRHLCLCKICENNLDKCPLCRSEKKASIQVFLS